jgi:hypothetical protein
MALGNGFQQWLNSKNSYTLAQKSRTSYFLFNASIDRYEEFSDFEVTYEQRGRQV